ncbi:hypothetical protein Q1J52_03985 [Pseudomonas lijiangensis]|uniref:DUF7668 domain-containing protein n=1 Tax=Pseudomonas TaxID=286 RepID=UPI000BA35568|nr:hypothetical protein [Pseudomonas sp. Irchel 3A18]
MNIDESIKLKIVDLLEALVKGDFERISAKNWYGRLNKPDIETRLSEYGNTLTLPPASFMEKIDIYEYNDGSGLRLDIPLWTEEEGMSDLTLSVEILNSKNEAALQMIDLRVL